jgi:hypothetical protein
MAFNPSTLRTSLVRETVRVHIHLLAHNELYNGLQLRAGKIDDRSAVNAMGLENSIPHTWRYEVLVENPVQLKHAPSAPPGLVLNLKWGFLYPADAAGAAAIREIVRCLQISEVTIVRLRVAVEPPGAQFKPTSCLEIFLGEDCSGLIVHVPPDKQLAQQRPIGMILGDDERHKRAFRSW